MTSEQTICQFASTLRFESHDAIAYALARMGVTNLRHTKGHASALAIDAVFLGQAANVVVSKIGSRERKEVLVIFEGVSLIELSTTTISSYLGEYFLGYSKRGGCWIKFRAGPNEIIFVTDKLDGDTLKLSGLIVLSHEQ